jgi:thiol-disulfide isomerase/thioredoxin
MQKSTRKRLLVALPIVVIAALAAFFYLGKIRPMIRAGKQEGQFLDPNLRRSVADFRFETKSGVRSIADYQGKVVIVDVWATWCAPCVASIPHLARMVEKRQAEGLEIVAVSTDDKGWAAVDRFVETRADINYTLAVPHPAPDFQLSTLIDFSPLGQVAALPTVFVIDRQGRLAGKFVGAGRYAEVESLVTRLLSEESTSVTLPSIHDKRYDEPYWSQRLVASFPHFQLFVID